MTASLSSVSAMSTVRLSDRPNAWSGAAAVLAMSVRAVAANCRSEAESSEIAALIPLACVSDCGPVGVEVATHGCSAAAAARGDFAVSDLRDEALETAAAVAAVA